VVRLRTWLRWGSLMCDGWSFKNIFRNRRYRLQLSISAQIAAKKLKDEYFY
jgi:hypothetical protein